VRGLTDGVAAGGCDNTAGALDLWTIVQDDEVGGGTLILSTACARPAPTSAADLPVCRARWRCCGADATSTLIDTPVNIDVQAATTAVCGR
jgi:hypothetical protein